MTIIGFSDGEKFDTSGPLRAEERLDGWYVLGQGYLIPCATREEAEQVVRELKGERDEKGGA